MEEIRWKQRFENFERSVQLLGKAVAVKTPDDITKAGIVQCFEICFELAWNLLKDYLNDQGIIVKFPRDTFKKAFEVELLSDGQLWIDMLKNRNLMSHTNNPSIAEKAHNLIVNSYYSAMCTLYKQMKNKL